MKATASVPMSLLKWRTSSAVDTQNDKGKSVSTTEGTLGDDTVTCYTPRKTKTARIVVFAIVP